MLFVWRGLFTHFINFHLLSTSPIIQRSKQLTQPTSHSTPSTKLLTIQANAAPLSQKDDSHSQKEESGGSSPRSEGISIFIFATILRVILISPQLLHF
jgi:hypothetical protein